MARTGLRALWRTSLSLIAFAAVSPAAAQDAEAEEVAANQLSVYELYFTNDAGTLQCFGQRDFSTQNTVFQNV